MRYFAYQLFSGDDSAALGVALDAADLFMRLAEDLDESTTIEQLQLGTVEAASADEAINAIRGESWTIVGQSDDSASGT